MADPWKQRADEMKADPWAAQAATMVAEAPAAPKMPEPEPATTASGLQVTAGGGGYDQGEPVPIAADMPGRSARTTSDPIGIKEFFTRHQRPIESVPGLGLGIQVRKMLDLRSAAKTMQIRQQGAMFDEVMLEETENALWNYHHPGEKQRPTERLFPILSPEQAFLKQQSLVKLREGVDGARQQMMDSPEGKFLTDYLEKQEELQRRGTTIGADIARGGMELPSYMVDFLVTGGLATLPKRAAQKAALRLLGSHMKRKGLKRLLVRGVGWVTEAGIRTALMPQRVAKGYLERQQPLIGLDAEGQEQSLDLDEQLKRLRVQPHVLALRARIHYRPIGREEAAQHACD